MPRDLTVHITNKRNPRPVKAGLRVGTLQADTPLRRASRSSEGPTEGSQREDVGATRLSSPKRCKWAEGVGMSTPPLTPDPLQRNLAILCDDSRQIQMIKICWHRGRHVQKVELA